MAQLEPLICKSPKAATAFLVVDTLTRKRTLGGSGFVETEWKMLPLPVHVALTVVHQVLRSRVEIPAIRAFKVAVLGDGEAS
ncbi:hypothetical protein D3C80_1673150 [compost metagenome]